MKKNYKDQKYNSNCFAIALTNCGIYIGQKVNTKRLVGLAHADRVIGRGMAKTIIQIAKLPLWETNNIEDVYENGGIVIIMHLIFNLHSVFCYPLEDKNKIMIVNSWIGCNKLPLDKLTFEKFLAKPPNNQMYSIEYI